MVRCLTLQKLLCFLGQLLPIKLHLHHLQQEGDVVVVEVAVPLELRDLLPQVFNLEFLLFFLNAFFRILKRVLQLLRRLELGHVHAAAKLV